MLLNMVMPQQVFSNYSAPLIGSLVRFALACRRALYRHRVDTQHATLTGESCRCLILGCLRLARIVATSARHLEWSMDKQSRGEPRLNILCQELCFRFAREASTLKTVPTLAYFTFTACSLAYHEHTTCLEELPIKAW